MKSALHLSMYMYILYTGGPRCLSGRASDLGARGGGGGGRNLPLPCCVIEQDSPKVLVIPRKRWVRPDITEIFLTGTLNLNTNKQTKHFK